MLNGYIFPIRGLYDIFMFFLYMHLITFGAFLFSRKTANSKYSLHTCPDFNYSNKQ